MEGTESGQGFARLDLQIGRFRFLFGFRWDVQKEALWLLVLVVVLELREEEVAVAELEGQQWDLLGSL